MRNERGDKQFDLFDALSSIFSAERLSRYLNENQSKEQVVLLYSWNIELSKSLIKKSNISL